MSEDPNKDCNDPMVPEYWEMGELLQNAVLKAGFQSETVEGIAVDIHDLLQATDAIKELLLPSRLSADRLPDVLAGLQFELDHIRWHCEAAVRYLSCSSRTDQS